MQAASSPFVLFRDDLAGRDLLFERPSSLIEASDPAAFAGALDRAEAARAAGKWLAGYFSYEAGYLFEPKLRPLIPERRRAPLMRFGVFDGPSENVLPGTEPRPSNGPIFDTRPAWSLADFEQ